MNPDQNPQPTPTEPTPQPAPEPIPAPVTTPPVSSAPEAPLAPQPETPTPIVAPAPSQPIGSAPAGTEPVVEKKPFPKKLVILIASIVGGLVILGVLAWLLLPLITGGKVSLGGSSPLATLTQSLKTYDGDGYSILVPSDFEQKQVGSSGKTISFSEKAEGAVKSSIILSSDDYSGIDRETIIAQMKQTYSKENIEKYAGEYGEQSIENFKSSDAAISGNEALRVEYDSTVSGDLKGHLTSVYVYGEDKYYSIIITALNTTAGLSANTDRIINSFKVN